MTDQSASRPDAPHVAVAVLAAGHGTRMRSAMPKHIHPVGGVPIVKRIIQAALAINPDRLLLVVSPKTRDMPERIGMQEYCEAVVQHPARGTAHAVETALRAVPEADYIVSVLGDNPLLTGDVMNKLVTRALESSALVTVLTCHVPKAEAYGRIDRDGEGGPMRRIVEEKHDDPALRRGPIEINSGIMVLRAEWARDAIPRLKPDPEKNEVFLTDLVELAVRENPEGAPWPVESVTADVEVSLGVNNRIQQADADEIIRTQTRARLMEHSGVTMIGRETIFIDESVEIGEDTTLLPGTVITGNSVIGTGCRIGPNAILEDVQIGCNVTIRSSSIEDSTVGDGSDVGPYAHIRRNTVVGKNVHIGNFAELKNSTLHDGAKMGHVSYMGDAEVGADANIGAGSITANFDGERKNRTEIGEGAFLGCDTILIAPVTVGAGAKTGAGAVVNRSVEDGATVVGIPARVIRRMSDSNDSPTSVASDEEGR